LVGTVCLAGFSPVYAEPLEQIEGLSVEVSWTQWWSGWHLQRGRFDEGATTNRSLRLYISTQGRVFEYPAESNTWAYGPTVFTLDQAKPLPHDQAMTWTMMNGHLTKIFKLIEGFSEQTISIDPVTMTCTFALQQHSDPKTGRVISYLNAPGSLLDEPLQTKSSKIASHACKLTRGNVFAPAAE
jgi:hypothetical protein